MAKWGTPSVAAIKDLAVDAVKTRFSEVQPTRLSDVALKAALGSGSPDWLKAVAGQFGFAFTALTTVDAATGLPTAAAVLWPDGTTGTFTGATDGANGYTGYAVTFGTGGTAKTVTASGITYDAATGLPLGPTSLAVV